MTIRFDHISGQDISSYYSEDMAHHMKWCASTLDILIAAAKSLSMARTMESITEVVRKAARQLMDADGITFVLSDNGYCHYVDEDAISPLWKGQRFPMDICISGWVISNAQPVIIDDVFRDARIPATIYRKTFVQSMAMVPIPGQRPLGAIGAYWSENYTPSPENMWSLQSLADITSLAIENVRLYTLLQDKFKALEESNHELTRFAWMVSHDLQDPMSTIDKTLHALEEEVICNVSPMALQHLKVLRIKTDHMRKRMNDLFDYAHLETKMETDDAISEIDGHTLINETLKLVGLPPSFQIQLMGDIDKMWVQRMPLQQIMSNLIQNVVKHHHLGNGVITINIKEERLFYNISIIDDGPGIANEKQNTLFEMFQKSQGEEHEKCSAMGLALVKKILLSYGGNISVSSELGKGAAFHFIWPKSLFRMIGKQEPSELVSQ